MGEIDREESLEQSSDLRTTKGVIFAGNVCGPQALHTRGTRRITADEVEQGHSESVFRGKRSSMGP